MKKIALFLLVLSICSSAFAQSTNKKAAENDKSRITFVELGSVNCIPCKQM